MTDEDLRAKIERLEGRLQTCEHKIDALLNALDLLQKWFVDHVQTLKEDMAAKDRNTRALMSHAQVVNKNTEAIERVEALQRSRQTQ
jgi:hypothetical protein